MRLFGNCRINPHGEVGKHPMPKLILRRCARGGRTPKKADGSPKNGCESGAERCKSSAFARDCPPCPPLPAFFGGEKETVSGVSACRRTGDDEAFGSVQGLRQAGAIWSFPVASVRFLSLPLAWWRAGGKVARMEDGGWRVTGKRRPGQLKSAWVSIKLLETK